MTAVPAGAINCCTDCWGSLEVWGDGGSPYPVSLNTQAWCVTNGKALLRDIAWRGKNTLYPGVEGRSANPRRKDQTDYILDFIISGVVDENNSLTSDDSQGLQDNIDYLRTYVLDAPAPPDTGRIWMLTALDGTQYVAEVQPPEQGEMLVTNKENQGLWVGKLHIVVPVPWAPVT